MDYPIWYEESERKAFDKIREVAVSLNAGSLIVLDHDSTVLIELQKEKASLDDWNALEVINCSDSPLMAAFTYPYREEGGKAYAIR